MRKLFVFLPIMLFVAAACNQSLPVQDKKSDLGNTGSKNVVEQKDKQKDKKDDRAAGGGQVDKQAAFLEGLLSHPSEGIPIDMKVCAEEISTKKLYCTDKHIKDKKGNSIGYRLEVPGGGSYFVYATTAAMPGYKAYYSEFVTCGLDVSCRSHEPIGIKVNPGQTMKGIDPGDWYKFN